MNNSNVKYRRRRSKSISDLEEPAQSFVIRLATYFVYLVAVLFGLFYELIEVGSKPTRKSSGNIDDTAPLIKTLDSFYTRHLYSRIWKTFNNVIAGNPGRIIEVIERERDLNGVITLTDRQRKCINFGSYNYLGFSDDWQFTCRDRVIDSLNKYGIACTVAAMEGGTLDLHRELEEQLARFLGKEACMVFNTGYGTNTSAIPALFGKGCLLISDTLNHTSIVNGSRTR